MADPTIADLIEVLEGAAPADVARVRDQVLVGALEARGVIATRKTVRRPPALRLPAPAPRITVERVVESQARVISILPACPAVVPVPPRRPSAGRGHPRMATARPAARPAGRALIDPKENTCG